MKHLRVVVLNAAYVYHANLFVGTTRRAGERAKVGRCARETPGVSNISPVRKEVCSHRIEAGGAFKSAGQQGEEASGAREGDDPAKTCTDEVGQFPAISWMYL